MLDAVLDGDLIVEDAALKPALIAVTRATSRALRTHAVT